MRYKLLGRSGLRVSELALGTMTFGEEWGFGSSREESRAVFDAFVEAGGNFIDTANHYTNGTSEKYVGEFIASERGRYVVGTKYTLGTPEAGPNGSGNQRKNLVQALDASLKRLKTDYIDLYWVHAWDFMTPVEEVMRALDDQVRAGKILYVGISDAPAWVVSQANTLASLRGWTPFIAYQLQYNLLERTPEREMLPMARALDIGVTAWGTLASGMLSGKFHQTAQDTPVDSTRADWVAGHQNDRTARIVEVMKQIATELDCSLAQVALNWARQQPGQIIPVIGARKASQIRDNLDCLNTALTDEHLRQLAEVSAIELGFPHDFLKGDGIRQIVYGGHYSSIDPHHR